MYAFQKYPIMRVLQVIAFFGVLFGLEQMLSAGWGGAKKGLIIASIILFGSATIGVVVSVLAAYYKAQEHDRGPQDKIALDALEKIGKQKR